MKVLVTGATGFVGYYVVHELLAQGIKVVCSARDQLHAQEKDWYPRVEFVAYDLNQQEDNLSEKFHHPDALIHLAWQGLPNYKNLDHLEKEYGKQDRFLKQWINEGLKNMTVTGTCFEYGMHEGLLKETDHPDPDNPYALAKDTLRRSIEVYKSSHDISFKWLRLFYMYGKGQNEKSILPQLQQSINREDKVFNMSQGDQIRDYLPVEKVAKYIVACALQTRIEGIINVCSNQPIKIIELVKKYLSDTKQTISLNLGFYPYPDYEPFAFWGDNSKLLDIIQ